jgi:hypothetical protein
MNDSERLNEGVETLLADRSPAAQARCLDLEEQRMLLLAQHIRGSREQEPNPRFAEALLLQLRHRVLSSTLSVGD